MIPPKVENYYLHWISPPPEPSARLIYWKEKVEAGWKPNKRIRAFGYDEASEFYGVYIWEYLYVLRPILYWREKDSLGYAMAIDWINGDNKNECQTI